MKSKNLCKIIVGNGFTNDDLWGETFYVWTNAETGDELQAAYLAGVEKTGVNVQRDCDGMIEFEDFQKIKNLALKDDLTNKADNLLAKNAEKFFTFVRVMNLKIVKMRLLSIKPRTAIQ